VVLRELSIVNPQGHNVNLCFHYQVELFTEYLSSYYYEDEETGR
jgi:hypothetical protein